MYQSFIQLLEEAGYKKYMSKMGPVYLLERGNDRQMVFLTYHKDQKKENGESSCNVQNQSCWIGGRFPTQHTEWKK